MLRDSIFAAVFPYFNENRKILTNHLVQSCYSRIVLQECSASFIADLRQVKFSLMKLHYTVFN